MRVDNNKNKFLIFFTVLLFFLPRVNIISLGDGHTAGLRVDDIIILCIFISILFRGEILKLNVSIFHFLYLLFVVVLFISFGINSFDENNLLGSTSIFYPIRYLEYFTFFVVGSLITRYSTFIKIILYLALYQIITIYLQYFGIFPAFTSTDGITFTVIAGMTGGPWEVSIVLTLCFAVYVNHFSKLKYLIYSFIIIAILTYVNFYLLGSRSSSLIFIILTIALFLLTIRNFYYNNKIRYISVILIAFISISSFFLFKEISNESNSDVFINDCEYSLEVCSKNMLINRSGNLTKLNNYYVLIDFYKFVRTNVNEDKIPIGKLYNNENKMDKFGQIYFSNSNNIDLSWLMRMEKWIYGVSFWQDKLPYSIFLGIGPGATGPSFDGNWIRIFVENGIIGLLLIILLFISLIKKNLLNFLPVLTISLSMVFIDAFLAYKSVSLVLFIFGYYSSFKTKVTHKI